MLDFFHTSFLHVRIKHLLHKMSNYCPNEV